MLVLAVLGLHFAATKNPWTFVALIASVVFVRSVHGACQPGAYIHVEYGPGGSSRASCNPCPQGTHQPGAGQRMCIPCPVNSYSAVGSTQCTCTNHPGSPADVHCLNCANDFSPTLSPVHVEWLILADAFQRMSLANIDLHIHDGDTGGTPCSHVDVAFARNTSAQTRRF
eukprot:scpid102861/ scgid19889/ 